MNISQLLLFPIILVLIAVLAIPGYAEENATPASPANDAAESGQMPAGHPLPETSIPLFDDAPAVAMPRRFTHFRVGNRNVKSMMADEGFVWVGTSGGVIRYELATDSHRLFDLKSGLLANGIFHISKLNDSLVVGTYGGGMAVLNDTTEKWEIYNIPEGLADAFVYDVLQAANGDIWIATWSGANRISEGMLDDRSKWETYTVENTNGGLPNDWVYGLHEGEDGKIWMATEGGLALFHQDQWSNWSHADGLGEPYEVVREQLQFATDPAKTSSHHARQKVEQGLENVDMAYNPNYIVALTVDREGVVWCGTWGAGLARFDGKHWRNFTVADGLPANHVFMLYEDPNGQLWVGTSNGLAIMKDEQFTVLTTANGLFSNNVFSMAMADDGSAWIGSYGGVARLFDMN